MHQTVRVGRFSAPLAAALFALALAAPDAARALIVAPVSATASSQFSSSYGVANAIDQSGLTQNYTVGGDFDDFIALEPLHGTAASGEWFSARGDVPATLTFDLGEVYDIGRMALWSEESTGFGAAVLSISDDGDSYAPLTTINPTFGTSGEPNVAQIFGIGATFRFLRMEGSDCNGANYCGLGEVVFDSGFVEGASVPLPAAAPLLAAGLGGLAWIGRRRRS